MEQQTSVRTSFVEHFGEDQANNIMLAAETHKNGIHDKYGSDPFKWAICICIGYECLKRFAEFHNIIVPYNKLKEWILNCGELGTQLNFWGCGKK